MLEWPIWRAKLDLGPNSVPVASAIRLLSCHDGMAGDEKRTEPVTGDKTVHVS